MSNNKEIRNGLEEDSINIQKGFLSLVYSLDYPFGKKHLVNIIKGVDNKKVREYHHDKLKEFGIGIAFTKKSLESVLDNLIAENFLALNKCGFHPCVGLTNKGQRVISDISTSTNRGISSPIITPADLIPENPEDYDRELMVKLKEYRKTESDERHIPPYMIARDSVLKEIARSYPKSIEELLSIKNFGPRMAENYGKVFLHIVECHCSESLGVESEESVTHSCRANQFSPDCDSNSNFNSLSASKDTVVGRQILEGDLSEEISDLPNEHQNSQNKFNIMVSLIGHNSNIHPETTIQIPGNINSDHSAELTQNNEFDQCLSSQESDDAPLYRQLKTIQESLLQQEHTGPANIFNNQVLREIATRMPLTNEEFLEIPGMMSSDWYLYHDYYLKTVTSFIEEMASKGTFQGDTKESLDVLQEEVEDDTNPVLIIDGNNIWYQYDTVLYDELCKIRKEIAEENGILETFVLFDKNLEELCMNYPCSVSDLATLWPWADSSFILKKRDILDHISHYCEEHGITPPSVDSYVRLPRTEIMPGKSAYESLRMYRAGKSIFEIAKLRNKSELIISGHIASIIRFDNNQSISEFVDKDRREIIEAALDIVGDEFLKPVKQYLGSDYSYDEIKFVRAYLKRCREQSC